MIRCFSILLILALAGCQEPPAPTAEKVLYVNYFDQAVDTIPIEAWDQWLEAHRNCKIVSIATKSDRIGDNNPTTHVLVVYEQPKLGERQ